MPEEPKVRVRLKHRTILEPGCHQVEPGYVTEIPKSHYLETHHELLEDSPPPATASSPAAPPPEEPAAAPYLKE
jgi:hypothetical protein